MPKASYLYRLLFKPRKSKEDGNKDEDLAEEIIAQVLKQFAFETLVSATEGFHEDHKLGQGAFGSVYKGKLDDGSEIAVKKLLQMSKQGKEQFMNEAKMLVSMQHRNVVKFLGFSSRGEEMLLVNEYVANGSLNKLLFNPTTGRADALDWKRTYDIIVGIAKGLHYLHEELQSVIIHGDIKAENILVDESWIPKIADFGLACHFPEYQTHVSISRTAGTLGYMALEYVMCGHLSPKADAYSFGVLVLELISGQKNWSPHAQSRLHRAKELYEEGKSLEVMDPKLASSAVPDQVKLCVGIGLSCTQLDPQKRPTMGSVVLMLSENRGCGTIPEEEPMTHYGYTGSSSSGELANSRSFGLDIQSENMGVGLPRQRRQLDRAAPVRQMDVPYIYSIPSSSSGRQRRKLDRAAPVRQMDVPYIYSIPSSSSDSGDGIQFESGIQIESIC